MSAAAARSSSLSRRGFIYACQPNPVAGENSPLSSETVFCVSVSAVVSALGSGLCCKTGFCSGSSFVTGFILLSNVSDAFERAKNDIESVKIFCENEIYLQ